MEKKDFSFSLMFVPHWGSKVRTIKVSHRQMLFMVWAFGTLFVLLAIGAARFAYLNYELAKHQNELAKMEVLAQENEDQKTRLASLNREAEEMRQKLDSLNSLAGRISSMLQIKHTDVSRGGPVSREANFTDLSQQAEAQQQVLTNYLQSAENYADYLSHRPSVLPIQGRISSPYGYRRNPTGWGTEFHDGIDIEARYGDPVYAPGDGVIVFAGWHSGYGLRVDIDHGHGIQTFYGHNSKLKVQVGQKVKRGDLIALAGSTGQSTGVHVHWGATLFGQSTNPLNFLNDSK